MQNGIIRGSSSFLPSYLESLVRHLAVKKKDHKGLYLNTALTWKINVILASYTMWSAKVYDAWLTGMGGLESIIKRQAFSLL